MKSILHNGPLLERILFASKNVRTILVCRSMRDAWLHRKCGTEPIVDCIVDGRNLARALMKLSRFPDSQTAKRLATGDSQCDSGSIQKRLALEIMDKASVGLSSIVLEFAMQDAAKIGCASIVSAILERYAMAGMEERLAGWASCRRLVVMTLAVHSRKVDTVTVLMKDIIDTVSEYANKQWPGGDDVDDDDVDDDDVDDDNDNANGDEEAEAEADEEYENDEEVTDDEGDDADDDNYNILDAPMDDIIGDAISIALIRQGEHSERLRVIMYAFSVAVLSALGNREMLVLVYGFMKANLYQNVIDMCMMWTTRCALEQPIDCLMADLVSSGCVTVTITTVLQAMMRSSVPCMRFVMSTRSAAELQLQPLLLKWCVERFAARSELERLGCVAEFWARSGRHIACLRSVAAKMVSRSPETRGVIERALQMIQ